MSSRTLLVIVLLFGSSVIAEQKVTVSDAEQRIRAIETIRLKNPNKASAWSAYVAKGAIFHQGTGVVVKRDAFLTDADKRIYDDSLEMSDASFSQFGGVAVFSYVFARTRHDDPHNIRHQHLRRTVVYQRVQGDWQLITSAAAVIPWADLESEPVDQKILDTYVGLWTDVPEPTAVTITRDGNKLMAQASNETEKTELLPISNDIFVVRGEPALVTFQKDSNGHVKTSTWRDIGGSLQTAEKVSDGGKE